VNSLADEVLSASRRPFRRRVY